MGNCLADAIAGLLCRPIRSGGRWFIVRRGTHMGRASAEYGKCRLRYAANRIADGVFLSRGALCELALLGGDVPSLKIRLAHSSSSSGHSRHAQQGDDGFGDRDGLAFRADICSRLVFKIAEAIVAALCCAGCELDSGDRAVLAPGANAIGRLRSRDSRTDLVAHTDRSCAEVSQARV